MDKFLPVIEGFYDMSKYLPIISLMKDYHTEFDTSKFLNDK